MQTANSVDFDKVISACFFFLSFFSFFHFFFSLHREYNITRFVSDLVKNMFSHDAAQLLLIGKCLFVYLSVIYQIHINIQINIKIKYI